MQRAIWIITFFIILAIGYYWMVVDDSRTQQMMQLADNDDELSGDVNSTVVVYDRLEKKWIGTSKHVQTLQKETHAHYAVYDAQMDSIDIVFEEIKFSIEQLEETLIRKIDRVKDDVKNLEIPLDGNGNMLINYMSFDKIQYQKKKGEFRFYSAWHLIQHRKALNFKEKTVLFGDHSLAARDLSSTPLDGEIYNPLIFCIAMSNIINKSFL